MRRPRKNIPQRHFASVVLFFTLAAAPVGCGGGRAGSSDEDQIRVVSAAFNSAQLALFDGAPVYGRICSLFTQETKAATARALARIHKSGGCHEFWKLLQRSVLRQKKGPQRARTRLKFLERRMRHFHISSIRIKGDTAIVTANTSVIHGEGGPTVLKKEGGRWLIAGDRET